MVYNIKQGLLLYQKNAQDFIQRNETSFQKYAGSTTLITYGLLNIMHGGMHMVQAAQSFFLASSSMLHHDHEGHSETLMHAVEEFTHNPYVGLGFAGLGILGIYLGIKDHKRHKKLHDELNEKNARILELESLLGNQQSI